MKISRVATLAVLAVAISAGVASATPRQEFGWRTTYYDDAIYTNVVAVAGRECGGPGYHTPLIVTPYEVYEEWPC